MGRKSEGRVEEEKYENLYYAIYSTVGGEIPHINLSPISFFERNGIPDAHLGVHQYAGVYT